MGNRPDNLAPSRHRRTVLSVCLVLVFMACAAQQFPLGQFRDFSLPEYYDVPHEKQMKSLLQGREAQPLGEGRVLIKQLRLETFREDGAGEFILRARDCLYNSKERSAASPGPLEMKTADGHFFTEGEGFLWQEDDSLLTISNRVHTIIRLGQRQAPKP